MKHVSQKQLNRDFARISVSVEVPLPRSIEEAESFKVDVLGACQDAFIKMVRRDLQNEVYEAGHQFVKNMTRKTV
jgi:hypothetical protein